MELTYHEIGDILVKKYIAALSTGFTLLPGKYEISDFNLLLKSSLPDNVKLNIAIDDMRLRSNLATSKTIKFSKKRFYMQH